jgi:DNA polymerase-3 subunit delta
MQIDATRIAEHLKKGMAPVYLVAGDEPLLVQEAVDAIRTAARTGGYTDRHVHDAGAGFDWGVVLSDSQSLSLFAERRLIEIRLPTGKAGAEGAVALKTLAETPPADTVVLITAPAIEKSARDSAWVEAVGACGAVVSARAIGPREFPSWIGARLHARGLKADTAAIDRLVFHTDGNLLACAQEIDKLALILGEGADVREADLNEVLADSARFNVFRLVDTALAGDGPAAARMLASLRAEGLEPILPAWALAREVRSFASMALSVLGGATHGDAMQAAKVWSSRRTLVANALKRLKPTEWLALLPRVAHIDRVIKGRAKGDAWLEIERLTLVICGLKS